MNTKTVEMQNTLSDIGNVRRGNGDFGAAARKLFQPQRNVLYHILIRTFLGDFVHTVQVMFLFRSVDGDAYAEVVAVLLDEILNGFLMIVDAIGGEGEAVTIEPMVIPTIQLDLDVIANLVDKFYLKELTFLPTR